MEPYVRYTSLIQAIKRGLTTVILGQKEIRPLFYTT